MSEFVLRLWLGCSSVVVRLWVSVPNPNVPLHALAMLVQVLSDFVSQLQCTRAPKTEA